MSILDRLCGLSFYYLKILQNTLKKEVNGILDIK